MLSASASASASLPSHCYKFPLGFFSSSPHFSPGGKGISQIISVRVRYYSHYTFSPSSTALSLKDSKKIKSLKFSRDYGVFILKILRVFRKIYIFLKNYLKMLTRVFY
uniref:Uncharacterized protein n=1 Tax=Sclerotinia borealis TaxID=77105 RepID=A0A088CAP6_9HELO|nr:hypothetical protein SBORM_0053 [Sclerotinia borealis]AHX83020.1 hypothetical protein SBORM_0053 [Sclerotinia borealis]